jgi:hypothetical protein
MRPDDVVSPLRRPLGVSLYFATHAAAALLLSLPTATLVASTGLGRFPDGDRALFQPGGMVLAEVARVLVPAAPEHLASSLVSGTLLGILLLVPHAALLVSLSRAEREPQAVVWGRAIGHLPTLISLSGLALLAQASVLFGMATLGGMIRSSASGSTTRGADLAYVGALVFGVLLVLALGLVRDLGRAAAVRDSLGSKEALRRGLSMFARAPGRSLMGWAAPAAVGLALVAFGAALTATLDVSRPGAWRVWLVAILHQTIAYALAWCRAFWLSTSLAIVKNRAPIAAATLP